MDRPFVVPTDPEVVWMFTAEPILHLAAHVVHETNERLMRTLAKALVEDLGGAITFATAPGEPRKVADVLRELSKALQAGAEIHPALRELGRNRLPAFVVEAARPRLSERGADAVRSLYQAMTTLLADPVHGDPGILVRAALPGGAAPLDPGASDALLPTLPSIPDPLLSPRGHAAIADGNTRDLQALAARLEELARIYHQSDAMQGSAAGALWRAIGAALDETALLERRIEDDTNPCYFVVRSRAWKTTRLEAVTAMAARVRRTMQRSLIQGIERGRKAVPEIRAVVLVTGGVLDAAQEALERSWSAAEALDAAARALGWNAEADWSQAAVGLASLIRCLRRVGQQDGFEVGAVLSLDATEAGRELAAAALEIRDWMQAAGTWSEADREQGWSFIDPAELAGLGIERSWMSDRFRPSFLRRAVCVLSGDPTLLGVGAVVCCEVQGEGGAWKRLAEFWEK